MKKAAHHKREIKKPRPMHRMLNQNPLPNRAMQSNSLDDIDTYSGGNSEEADNIDYSEPLDRSEDLANLRDPFVQGPERDADTAPELPEGLDNI